MNARPAFAVKARTTVLRCMLPLLVAGVVASCHKGTSVKSRRDYHKEAHAGKPHHDDGKATGESGWKTLDIPLVRGDNKALYEELRSWLGTPYKYAASEKGKGTDCSGMVMMVYQTVYHKPIERNSARIYEKNCSQVDRDHLREGDLVFFHGGNPGRITHVGIYLKEGYFVHTSSSKGVMVSRLSDRYWDGHYQCAGRVR